MKLNKRHSVLWWVGPRAAGLVVFLFLYAGEQVGAQPLGVGSVNRMSGTCGAANGSITIAGTGGTPPYQYSIDGINWNTTGYFGNLGPNTYTLYIMDAEVPPVTINTTVMLTSLYGPSAINYTSNNATCLNNDGTLAIFPVGGNPPYMISVGGGTPQTGNLFGGLPYGNTFVNVTDNNGCEFGQTLSIGLTDDEYVNSVPTGTVCEGVGVPLLLNTNATNFSWTPALGLSNPAIQNPIATPNATTTYTVTAMLGVCSHTATVTVNILPAPTPMVTPAAASLCPGQSVQLQGSGGVTYTWSPATYLSSTTVSNPMVMAPAKSITYSLNVTGANGCSSVQPALALVVVSPPPQVFAGDDTAIYMGQTLPLNAEDVHNVGFTNYQWTPAFGLNNPSIQDPVATITGDITYVVTATTPTGCTATDSIKIVEETSAYMVVPNAFTPNGDGRNDLLRVRAVGIKDFKFFRVFNRWGQLVFQTANIGEGWDGSIGGNAQPMGTYVWMAEGLDFGGKVIAKQGTVILVR